MPTITYLKHEIRVSPGTSSSGETAWVVVDGALRCFLGGELEAKRFLRERKLGQHAGPRAASWSIELESGSSTQVGTAERAADTAAYFRAQGTPHRVVRTEHCRHPGCDGSGEINERQRSGRYVQRPCPRHEAPVEVIEVDWWRSGCGFGLEGGDCYACELARARGETPTEHR